MPFRKKSEVCRAQKFYGEANRIVIAFFFFGGSSTSAASLSMTGSSTRIRFNRDAGVLCGRAGIFTMTGLGRDAVNSAGSGIKGNSSTCVGTSGRSMNFGFYKREILQRRRPRRSRH